MHRRFTVDGQGGPGNVSFHEVVDDEEAIILLEPVWKAWHAGDGQDGPGNATSYAIEMCVNADADWMGCLYNVGRRVAVARLAFGLGADRVVQHHRWSGKDCPAWMRGAGEWQRLMDAQTVFYRRLTL